jgi:hypothetical protein
MRYLRSREQSKAPRPVTLRQHRWEGCRTVLIEEGLHTFQYPVLLQLRDLRRKHHCSCMQSTTRASIPAALNYRPIRCLTQALHVSLGATARRQLFTDWPIRIRSPLTVPRQRTIGSPDSRFTSHSQPSKREFYLSNTANQKVCCLVNGTSQSA